MSITLRRSIHACLLLSACCSALLAQQKRIHAPIDKANAVRVRGNVPARARAEFDQGAVDPAFEIPAMVLHLKPAASQDSELQTLLAEQQNPASIHYHQWLTPEQYGERFGVGQEDIGQITAWLESQGFTIKEVSRSRTRIVFSGNAAQAKSAFATNIHRYKIRGAVHYSNASEPAVPAAFAHLVTGFRGLNNFGMKPHLVKESPRYNTGGTHHLVPEDIATIYNVAPLYAAGIDGTGQRIAVVGQTAIKIADITNFRSRLNLTAPNLEQIRVPTRPDPGIVSADVPEADLDIEWAGAMARNATIVYVYSDDVFESLQYAVDQNVAPVITMSYGSCESADLIDLPLTQAIGRQANAQGITWLAASGDFGAGDCEDGTALLAQSGATVDSPGVAPEVTSVGGTTFDEGGGSYWAESNSANLGSALSYIPEKVWNDTSLTGTFSAGGGGSSIFFPRPPWQTGPGVPDANFRHVPDVSMASSANHDGYYVYTGGGVSYFGGTSVAAPQMAGVVALLNQYLVSTGVQKQPGVGNINPALYRLAANSPGVFHDVVNGNNMVPCPAGTPACENGFVGYAAGPGYDRATGLGTPNVTNLVHQWSSQPPLNSAVVASLDQNPVFKSSQPDAQGNSWSFVLTLHEQAGIATKVTSLSIEGATFDPATVFGTTSIGAGQSISSKNLGVAKVNSPKNVVIAIAGMDPSGKTWSQDLTVPFNGVYAHLTIGGAANAASGQQAYAPGMIVSVYGAQLGNFIQHTATIPLPTFLAGFEASVNGVSSPLYYVSPTQVNIQIPYETAPGKATLTLGNQFENVDFPVQIATAAPGIFQGNGFIAAPFANAKRGQTTTLYITGEGRVTPSLATGRTPSPSTPAARLPRPSQAVSVTVGGVLATVQFAGVASGLVGMSQINFEVPATAPLGVQPVVITVGNAASPPANLTVSQ